MILIINKEKIKSYVVLLSAVAILLMMSVILNENGIDTSITASANTIYDNYNNIIENIKNE